MVEVELAVPGQEPQLIKTTTEPRIVGALRAMINRMPHNRTGLCAGGPGGDGAEANFMFRGAPGEPVTATATVPADTESQQDPCLGLSLKLAGRRRGVGLEYGFFIREAQKLLGVQIYTPPAPETP